MTENDGQDVVWTHILASPHSHLNLLKCFRSQLLLRCNKWHWWLICPSSSPVGALPAAHGGQTSDWASRTDLLPDQQRVIPVQRRRPGRQPLGAEQPLFLEWGARPLQHGYLHRSHDTGEFTTRWWWRHSILRQCDVNIVCFGLDSYSYLGDSQPGWLIRGRCAKKFHN